MPYRNKKTVTVALGEARGSHPRVSPSWAAHLFTVAFFASWLLVTVFVPPYVLPSPIAVLQQVAALLSDAGLLLHGAVSVLHVLSALVIAFVLGFALALLAHYLPVTRLLIEGRLRPFLNSFSSIGWAFLAVVWMGVSHGTVIFAISAVLLPLAMTNLREGLLRLDSDVVEMARSFGHAPLRRFRKVVLPLMFPYVSAALRICFGVGWVIAPTVEMFGGNSGYGYIINRATTDFDLPRIFAVLIVIIAFVYAVDRLIFAPVQARMQRHYASR